MELLLFALDDAVTRAAHGSGIDAVVIDLEHRGKAERQAGFDTGITRHTLDDIGRVKELTRCPVVVRVDGPGPDLARRLEDVAAAGADEVLVPMVADADEAAACLRAAPGALPVGVLVERVPAVADAERIGRLPLARVYVGLMDLMVERGSSSPFQALCDGTVDRVRAALPQPFGVAGLTRPGHGSPVPVELLAGELSRLGADFTFLRRSFLADLAGPTDLARAVAEIRRMLDRVDRRSPDEIAADRADLRARVVTAPLPS